MKAVFTLLASLLITVPLTAGAQSDDWRTLNLDLTDNFVQPAYDALAASTAGLGSAASAYCAAPDAAALAGLRLEFHNAMDDWQRIQHVKFGPVTYFNWQFRMQFWPDDNGTGGRQLDAMLAARDDAVLDADNFARQSVGVQGFPALERLLFGDEAQTALETEPFRCNLMATIAMNIASIGEGLAARWRDEFRATVVLDDDTGFFEDLQDASTDFVKALVETVPAIREQKLLVPMGESREGFRERRAESWRSQRSLRNIRLNLSALNDYYHAEADEMSIEHSFPPEEAAAVTTAFTEVLDLLAEMPDSLSEQAATDEGYARLVELADSLDLLYEAMETAVKNTDLYLGFNSLDGD